MVVVLPAPLGPEQREDLAAVDLQVDAVYRGHAAVLLAKSADQDGAARRQVRCCICHVDIVRSAGSVARRPARQSGVIRSVDIVQPAG